MRCTYSKLYGFWWKGDTTQEERFVKPDTENMLLIICQHLKLGYE